MSQTLILAITLFTLLSTVAFFWYQDKPEPGR